MSLPRKRGDDAVARLLDALIGHDEDDAVAAQRAEHPAIGPQALGGQDSLDAVERQPALEQARVHHARFAKHHADRNAGGGEPNDEQGAVARVGREQDGAAAGLEGLLEDGDTVDLDARQQHRRVLAAVEHLQHLEHRRIVDAIGLVHLPLRERVVGSQALEHRELANHALPGDEAEPESQLADERAEGTHPLEAMAAHQRPADDKHAPPERPLDAQRQRRLGWREDWSR